MEDAVQYNKQDRASILMMCGCILCVVATLFSVRMSSISVCSRYIRYYFRATSATLSQSSIRPLFRQIRFFIRFYAMAMFFISNREERKIEIVRESDERCVRTHVSLA